ncbi:MAG: gamma carbonic anhydrase family protein, partial [Desulfosalsimonas sp.]
MPEFHETILVHETSSQMGDVKIGPYSSLWPGSSIRGDFSPIRIGKGTSIQDCCVLHSTPSDEVHVGDFVTVGHGAVLHGCTVEDNCIIGMNA